MSPLRRPRPLLWSLAFTASLLLVLLPAAGRLYRAGTADPLAPALQAFCTADGLALRSPAPQIVGDAGRPHGDGAPAGEAGDDCAYCPLLATTGLPAVASPVLPPLPPMAVAFPPRLARRAVDRHPIGQGPRGPPARFAA